MAESHITMTVRFSDIDKFRLLLWELRMLTDEMRVGASPHADRLERLLDRFTENEVTDDDRPGNDG